MSGRAVTLPVRTLVSGRQLGSQWICRRCLATQTESSDSRPLVTPPTPLPEWYDPSLPASKRVDPEGNPYRLTKTDFLLKKPLNQPRIPQQYLTHSTAEHLHQEEKRQRDNTKAHKRIVGVVVRSERMDKTVTVRIAVQQWNKRIKKYFQTYKNHLVHDPNSSLVTGDVVELHRLHVSKQVDHVVARIVSPFGTPVEQRPPIPSPDERLASYKEKRFAKLKRRELRVKAAEGDAEAIQELKNMGLDPGDGTQAGVGKSGNVQKQVGKSRNPGKGAILGEKGQKLPEGVLPGGKHEVGKIDERAKHNKGKAMKFDTQAEDRLLEAKEKGEELERQNLGSDSALR
ncbi:hypothetical protein M409DRAFT_28943 [Zasmidium cellare ATCC 36951]|uniref:Nucleic acid-binding protein n=1 Tax=Zasmidium cellare ATCC 36951 TaxID=1080233 RepID=A0A6A6C486_ZASCE|nr:uncharacterized protein M409DRAFT_28943 [Zasmidium cellare ATCC 36951]KAF2160559.1 hypothetical protein M409DRAFT_28943 [Zasmidium cellare ATCC 36951]